MQKKWYKQKNFFSHSQLLSREQLYKQYISNQERIYLSITPTFEHVEENISLFLKFMAILSLPRIFFASGWLSLTPAALFDFWDLPYKLVFLLVSVF